MANMRSRSGKDFPSPFADLGTVPWYLVQTYDSDNACITGFSALIQNGFLTWYAFAYDSTTRPDSGVAVVVGIAIPVCLFSCLIVAAVLYMRMRDKKPEEEANKVQMTTNPGATAMVPAGNAA